MTVWLVFVGVWLVLNSQSSLIQKKNSISDGGPRTLTDRDSVWDFLPFKMLWYSVFVQGKKSNFVPAVSRSSSVPRVPLCCPHNPHCVRQLGQTIRLTLVTVRQWWSSDSAPAATGRERHLAAVTNFTDHRGNVSQGYHSPVIWCWA